MINFSVQITTLHSTIAYTFTIMLTL